MRKLKRKLLGLFAVLVVAAGLSVGAPAASAAPHCNSVSTGVSQVAGFYGGYPWIYHTISVGSCTDVNGIRFVKTGSGWYDGTTCPTCFKQMNGWTSPSFGGYPLITDPLFYAPSVGAPTTGQTITLYGVGTCWFSGTRLGYTIAVFQLHGTSTGTWTGNMNAISVAHNITCP